MMPCPRLPPQLDPDKIEARAREVTPLVEKLMVLLAGKDPDLQGAVLADGLALWLAGHHVPGDRQATRDLRVNLLSMHLFAVRHLTELNARILGTELSLDEETRSAETEGGSK